MYNVFKGSENMVTREIKFNLLLPLIIGFGIWAVTTGRVPWETIVFVALAGSEVMVKLGKKQ